MLLNSKHQFNLNQHYQQLYKLKVSLLKAQFNAVMERYNYEFKDKGVKFVDTTIFTDPDCLQMNVRLSDESYIFSEYRVNGIILPNGDFDKRAELYTGVGNIKDFSEKDKEDAISAFYSSFNDASLDGHVDMIILECMFEENNLDMEEHEV